MVVYSLNAPVPGRVARLAADLFPELVAFETVRDRHTLVVKRLGDAADEYSRLEACARRALAGTPACEARVARIDYFERPARGPAPVVYLAVESPGLVALHRRLCETFEPVPGIESEDYVPHVTLARGGDLAAARRLADREIEPVTWTITELELYDAAYGERAGVVRLPVPR